MTDFNEHNLNLSNKSSKEEQLEFNKKFLSKLMLFMFFYRFYIMHIDQQGIMVDFAENCFNELSDIINPLEQEQENPKIIIDYLD